MEYPQITTDEPERKALYDLNRLSTPEDDPVKERPATLARHAISAIIGPMFADKARFFEVLNALGEQLANMELHGDPNEDRLVVLRIGMGRIAIDTVNVVGTQKRERYSCEDDPNFAFGHMQGRGKEYFDGYYGKDYSAETVERPEGGTLYITHASVDCSEPARKPHLQPVRVAA